MAESRLRRLQPDILILSRMQDCNGELKRQLHQKLFLDEQLLLILLSFLANSKVSPELLVRGASSRRRWNEYGEVDEISGS